MGIGNECRCRDIQLTELPSSKENELGESQISLESGIVKASSAMRATA